MHAPDLPFEIPAPGAPLPWCGEMELPPCGTNQAYVPCKRGKSGVNLMLRADVVAWKEKQAGVLLAQGCPRIDPHRRLALALDIRTDDNQHDLTGYPKLIEDCLKDVLGRPDPALPERVTREKGRLKVLPPLGWDDRYTYLTVAQKSVDKANPGVLVYVDWFTEDLFMAFRDYMIGRRRIEGVAFVR